MPSALEAAKVPSACGAVSLALVLIIVPKWRRGGTKPKTKTWTKEEAAGAADAFVQTLVLIIVPEWRRGWTKAETKTWTKGE